MPDKRRMRRSEPLLLRFQAGSIFTPDGVANEIKNMCSREENTLRSVVGPATYVPDTNLKNRPFHFGLDVCLLDLSSYLPT